MRWTSARYSTLLIQIDIKSLGSVRVKNGIVATGAAVIAIAVVVVLIFTPLNFN